MMKAFTLGVLSMMLCVVAPSPATSQEDPEAAQPGAAVTPRDMLSGDQVRELLQGNTEIGEGLKDEEQTGRHWTAYFAPDGTARRQTTKGGEKAIGTWFIDAEGRACFQWEGKEEPKCDLIAREGDSYLRIRDGQVRARIKIQKGNPGNL
jgi:hypothetical protein